MRHGKVSAGSTAHRILLALRAGETTQEQLNARFTSPSNALTQLDRAGLIEKPMPGKKGEVIRLTAAGRDLVAPGGPMSRANTEIVYCQL
ncbi:MAG: hypothetical protein ACM3VY_00545 [Candidatus Bathyarchaeota archaeon]